MENEENVKQIDLRLVFKRIGEHKKLFFITLPIVIALSSYIILCVPRTYKSETAMAPEASPSMDVGALEILPLHLVSICQQEKVPMLFLL